MHNPLVLHSEKLLHAQIKSGYSFFVRQSFPRGCISSGTEKKAAFLITHYNDLNRANVHLEALPTDFYRKCYDLRMAEEKEKLLIAVNQPAGYAIYAPLLRHPWKPGNLLAGRIREYVETVLHWNPDKHRGLKADLFLQFGELFITLKSGSQEAKIRLEEIDPVVGMTDSIPKSAAAG